MTSLVETKKKQRFSHNIWRFVAFYIKITIINTKFKSFIHLVIQYHPFKLSDTKGIQCFVDFLSTTRYLSLKEQPLYVIHKSSQIFTPYNGSATFSNFFLNLIPGKRISKLYDPSCANLCLESTTSTPFILPFYARETAEVFICLIK
jgi:hypothetical protein